MTRRLLVVAAALIVLLVACSPPTAQESAIRDATNDYRVNVVGVQPEALSNNIQARARDWANYLAATQSFEHSNLYILLTEYPSLTLCGENILRGPNDYSAIVIVNAWKTSPAHDLNLRNPAFSMTGVGVAYDVAGTQYVVAQYCG